MELEGKEQVNPNKRKEISPPKVRRRAKNMACHICLTREHWSSSCPYILKYPPGATVGPFARILCLCCGEVMPHPGDPGVDWEARVDLKACFNYPSIEEQLMELKKAALATTDVHQRAQLIVAPARQFDEKPDCNRSHPSV